MGNPRAVIAYDGIDNVALPFNIDGVTILFDKTKAGGCASVGLAVKISANSQVALVSDADNVDGRLERVEGDGKCAVTIDGIAKLPAGSGATVTAGKKICGALGAASAKGYIRNIDPTVLAEVAKANGKIIDASDGANVVVLF